MLRNVSPLGVGLGFRVALAEELLAAETPRAAFVEVAPENYLDLGGERGRWLAMAAERWPVVAHGLCGDFAGAAPLDVEYLTALKRFLRATGAQWYSDHLCLTNIGGAESHDLLPMPMNERTAERAARRVREVADVLELPIAVENVSAYMRVPGNSMTEAAFVCSVLEQSECRLLLDVNNVYVNSVNFKADAKAFIDAMPLDRVVEIHVAGHAVEIENELLIDTHGAAIVDPVYELLAYTLGKMRHAPPVLLERDHDIPRLAVLEDELARLQSIVDEVRGRR